MSAVPIGAGPAPTPAQVAPGTQAATPGPFSPPSSGAGTAGLKLQVENLVLTTGNPTAADAESAGTGNAPWAPDSPKSRPRASWPGRCPLAKRCPLPADVRSRRTPAPHVARRAARVRDAGRTVTALARSV